MSLTILIMAKNEAANIEACLDSAIGADELLVIDDYSEDRTAELAKAKGARVLHRKLDDFASQMNYGADQASGEWIFVLDSDERFTPDLLNAIRSHINSESPAIGTCIRHNFAFGHRHRFGPLKPDRVRRLFPRQSARWHGLVHAKLMSDLPEKHIGGLIHYTYKNWDHYFRKLDQYAGLWADNAHLRGKTAGAVEIFFRLLWNQFKMFGLNLGFLGGPICWALCYLNGEYTLKKYLKLADLNLSGPQPAPQEPQSEEGQ